LRETPVDVYGVLDWLATSARDLLTPDIGHAMVRMQHAVFADRDGATSAAGQRWATCWRISDWPLLAAADTAGAEIADRFRVAMPQGSDDHRGRWCVTNCVTITTYDDGLPWILRDV
jgi:hypothetical protein